MPIRWDALLARHTATELSGSLVGARARGLRLDGETRELALLFDDRTLLWSLHPSRGWPRLTGPLAPSQLDLDVGGRVAAVHAPPDERLVCVQLSGPRATTLVVELMGNQWNALLVEEGSLVIRHVLRRRDTGRVQRVGETYVWPKPLGRAGVDGGVSEAEWLAELAPLDAAQRSAALIRAFAWTSPLNAAALLGAPDGPEDASDLAVGYARWMRMARSAAAEPVVLEASGGAQPYPFPLAGTPSRRVPSLLDAFAALAAPEARGETSSTGIALDALLLAELDAALRRAAGRVRRLEHELADLPDSAPLRAVGDLILARYADIPQGASRVSLTAFDGSTVEVELDPAEPPHANAARFYREAARAERAAERLPVLLDRARGALARMREVVARATAGTITEEEARAALGVRAPRTSARTEDRGPALPYRVYRSSGGLEIRVGRGARHNDELTFRHSSPGDVWLHARHVEGAHVILRWLGPGNPPARDLAEAATLAALHSKARTSASVPVDWTLRKYVRKPRKAPPGRVAAERVETLFVRPEPALLETLAASTDA
jgi:predicted ribosome quality control (RQC) complex YloA/Tae2 family protein